MLGIDSKNKAGGINLQTFFSFAESQKKRISLINEKNETSIRIDAFLYKKASKIKWMVSKDEAIIQKKNSDEETKGNKVFKKDIKKSCWHPIKKSWQTPVM